jgi:hypothetical protein
MLMKKLEHEHAWKRRPQTGLLQDSVDVHKRNGNTSHAVEPREIRAVAGRCEAMADTAIVGIAASAAQH